jgi:carbamoyltransferase
MPDNKPWILGLSSAFHNGSACLLHGDELVVAVQEERLTRVKRDRLKISGHSLAIDYCLSAANITARHLDMIVDCTITLKGQQPDEMLESSTIAQAARADVTLASLPHHLGHAYSVHATSGFNEALVLIVDGGGSFVWQLPTDELDAAITTGDEMCEHVSVYHFTRYKVECIEKHMAQIPYAWLENHKGMLPFATIGHMYASASKQIFGDYLEAGKVMGLAPYGTPTISVSEFLDFDGNEFIFHNLVPERFPYDSRWPLHKVEYQNLAASTQRALEFALNALVSKLVKARVSQNLCYAGGVALNSVANHTVIRKAGFDRVHIIPAAEDSGPAIGAAFYGLSLLGGTNHSPGIRSDFLGRPYTVDETSRALDLTPAIKKVSTKNPIDTTAELLESGKIVGWFEGRSEFGPRALGHRSILCDARRDDAKMLLNSRVKHREEFRPFAPIILADHVQEWFETDGHHLLMDFMLEVCAIKLFLREKIPGVVHVDGTGRLQTVRPQDNPSMYALLQAFYARTGVPMLINTSFNVMGEPLVETPKDAMLCFLITGMDYCLLDNTLVSKEDIRTSVLDLVPVVNGHVHLDPADSGSVSVDTEHGRWTYKRLAPQLLQLLKHIDGESSGWDLYHAKRHLFDDRSSGILELAQLARYSLIHFTGATPRR